MRKLLLVILVLFNFTCAAQNGGEYTFECECMGVEADGSETILAWGNGKNRFDAVEQAKKNALLDVIFKGINKGRGDCSKRPLLGEVNAKSKYESYFNKFFADDGPYKEFVGSEDERLGDKLDRDKQKGRKSRSMSVVVRVERAKLKDQLVRDNILKQ
jgi:hypothetical protein